jgi:hypothetical protein
MSEQGTTSDLSFKTLGQSPRMNVYLCVKNKKPWSGLVENAAMMSVVLFDGPGLGTL